MSLTNSFQKEDAWLLGEEIFAMLLRACFLIMATSSALVAIVGYTPAGEILFDWQSEQLICSSASAYTA